MTIYIYVSNFKLGGKVERLFNNQQDAVGGIFTEMLSTDSCRILDYISG
jgi:hypothetical protein